MANHGKIELSSLFAEHCLDSSKESWGLVIPTGIAVNESNKEFFAKLIDENRLISLYDFENKEALFDIHRMFKFCLLTAGKPQGNPRVVQGGFYLTRIDHLLDPNRVYTLQTADFARLNPNTKTCPVFRTSKDAELTAKIYKNSDILMNESTGTNSWGIRFASTFNMASDSNLFETYQSLKDAGAEIIGNVFHLGKKTFVPLFEGKMFWLYNHHFGTWPIDGERPNTIDSPSIEELSDPCHNIMPWYWVEEELWKNKKNESEEGFDNGNSVLKMGWNIAFRKLTNALNERTFIASILPGEYSAGHSISIFSCTRGTIQGTILLAIMSSIVFDYAVRQKVGGTNMSLFFFKQFPVLLFDSLPENLKWDIVRRVAELSYFNHDLDGWAEELYSELNAEQKQQLPQLNEKKPWRFNPEHRTVLQAELDAIIGHLYGLNTEDMRYILDPEDVCGPGCINETFRVLKDNEIRQYGEFLTKRLVMDAWYRFGFNK